MPILSAQSQKKASINYFLIHYIMQNPFFARAILNHKKRPPAITLLSELCVDQGPLRALSASADA